MGRTPSGSSPQMLVNRLCINEKSDFVRSAEVCGTQRLRFSGANGARHSGLWRAAIKCQATILQYGGWRSPRMVKSGLGCGGKRMPRHGSGMCIRLMDARHGRCFCRWMPPLTHRGTGASGWLRRPMTGPRHWSSSARPSCFRPHHDAVGQLRSIRVSTQVLATGPSQTRVSPGRPGLRGCRLHLERP